MTLRVSFVLVLAAVVFAGCTPVRTRTVENPAFAQAYQLRSVRLQALDHWALDGRLAISDGQEGGSGNLSWFNDEHLTRMSFRGALGKGAWQLQTEAAGARLELANGDVHFAPSVAELVLREVGWKVPVEALTWWIKGLAQPDDWETRALDENGRLKKLRQFGWDVDFTSYGESQGYWLPTRLSARRGEYSVKIAVREWRLGEESAAFE